MGSDEEQCDWGKIDAAEVHERNDSDSGIVYGVGQRAEMEMKSLGDEVHWGIGWRRLFEGGNDGSDKQIEARGSGNRRGDWESGSQSASGGQGGSDGQEGARGHRQAGGCVEESVAEDDEAVKEGAAVRDRQDFGTGWCRRMLCLLTLPLASAKFLGTREAKLRQATAF
jgi:hypothetical protein